MIVACIDQRDARVRRGGAGDAGSIVKRLRRGSRVSLIDPKGHVIKALGRRLVPLAMLPASPRDTILAQGLDNMVQVIIIPQIGS